jgi:uncharacterized alkaline shock family protein YloU
VTTSLATPITASPTGESPTRENASTIFIADIVVSKLAARAALDIPDAGGAAQRIGGRVPPGAGHLGTRETRLDTAPQATVEVDGALAFIDLTISVRWPAPVPQVTTQVRDRVVARVQELTGLTVAQVRIAVTALATDAPALRRLQ